MYFYTTAKSGLWTDCKYRGSSVHADFTGGFSTSAQFQKVPEIFSSFLYFSNAFPSTGARNSVQI